MKRILFFFFALPVLVPGLARAQTVTNRPFPGLVLYSEVRTNPPERLFVAEVDLKNPHLHLRVAPGGPDPDGSGPWQTTLMQPTKIAARDHFDLVINGDFFDARNTKDGEGTNALFRANGWARVEGPAMTDGLVPGPPAPMPSPAWWCIRIKPSRLKRAPRLDRMIGRSWRVTD